VGIFADALFTRERAMIDLASRIRRAQEAVLPQFRRTHRVPSAVTNRASVQRAAMPAPSEPVTVGGHGADPSLSDRIASALLAAQSYVLGLQKDDGNWCGELQGDTIVESEYILTLHFLGQGDAPRARKLAAYIRQQQLPSGGWAIYEGGPPELSASVKAYFVLKLQGDDPDAPHMVKARELIRSLGGIEGCNSFTKIYLAIFGQIDWDSCPAVPPEIVLLPEWLPFNLYRMSYWSRCIVVPLSVIWARKPSCALPERGQIRELRTGVGRPRPSARRELRARLWAAFFRGLDRALKTCEATGFHPWRAAALQSAEAWILERLEGSDGLGAILPPIINTIFAFRSLGYAMEDPRLVGQVRELEKLEIEEEGSLRIQPCFSAVWDSALALQALFESGLPVNTRALQSGARWLLDKEVRRVGDWKRRNPEGEPGGWFFEYRNEFYPDNDDTAAVLTTLSRLDLVRDDARRRTAVERGLRWLLTMQNPDGGWAAFDRGCDNEVLTFIPFADHNAMIDPSCEDITGRTLEALHHLGFPPDDPVVRRGVRFLERVQAPDGTWYGRWGCNYIYGTWLALRGLEKAGEDMGRERYQRAGDWLYARQNEEGGWGELPRSYDDPGQKGIGPPTASQTAWALMALFALGHTDTPGVRRGLEYLLRTQRPDGSWYDAHWTGTGFPKVFYLRYHLYASYFPLLAFGIYRRIQAQARRSEQPVSLVEQVTA
jgi:squalene-hopene/tetraprenyl-beta-curcumene cyclase